VIDHVTPDFPPAFISAGNADPLLPQSVEFAHALSAQGVPVVSLFFEKAHKPPLGHEYQFDLDGADGKAALDRSERFLKHLP
jgi:acetyl esterase/lipase